MSIPRAWMGSLYWRIALACLGLLAAGLAIQLVFVVATLSRPSGLQARITAQRLARTVASDLQETLELDPAASVRQVLARHQDTPLPVFFVTVEGAVLGEHGPCRSRWPGEWPTLAEENAAGLGSVDAPVGVAAVEVLGRARRSRRRLAQTSWLGGGARAGAVGAGRRRADGDRVRRAAGVARIRACPSASQGARSRCHPTGQRRPQCACARKRAQTRSAACRVRSTRPPTPSLHRSSV